jgi:26S proteasome non-ATPase regulatory subunit 10
MEEPEHFPLHEAAREGKNLLVRSLLNDEPKLINKKDQDGRTALFWAISSGNSEAVSIILKFIRISLESKDENRKKPASRFDIDDEDEAGWTVLHIASSIGSLQIIELIMPFNPDVNFQTRAGQTALHFAVSKVHIDVVKYLLNHGASVRLKDRRNQNVLMRAAAVGNLPITRLLIEAKSPLNTADSTGWTALHHAFAEGHGDVAVELINHGADMDRTDAEGLTALDVALNDKVKKYVTNRLSS